MNKFLLKIALKYSLIQCIITLIFSIVSSILFDPNELNTGGLFGSIIGMVLYISFIFITVKSHNEFFNKKNRHITFIDALIVGFIIIILLTLISTTYLIINHEYFIAEKMEIYYKNIGSKFGNKIENPKMSTSMILYSAAFNFTLYIIILLLTITIESIWIIYKKAGKIGWTSIVPFYNLVVLLEIVKKPSWWIILILIPFVNIIYLIWITNLLSKSFGKNEGFTLGLIFLPFIFYPLLGMSDAKYLVPGDLKIEEHLI